MKVSILTRLANPDTASDIVSELTECVNDSNVKLSCLAVRSMDRIACHGQGGRGAAEAISCRLVDMLDLNVEHVSSEAATALTLLVRKHAPVKPLVAPSLAVPEPTGKASVLYLLGELVPEAPYALEKLIDWNDDIADVGVKVALLTSTVQGSPCCCLSF